MCWDSSRDSGDQIGFHVRGQRLNSRHAWLIGIILCMGSANERRRNVCNVISHWLSPYTEWSLINDNHANPWAHITLYPWHFWTHSKLRSNDAYTCRCQLTNHRHYTQNPILCLVLGMAGKLKQHRCGESHLDYNGYACVWGLCTSQT